MLSLHWYWKLTNRKKTVAFIKKNQLYSWKSMWWIFGKLSNESGCQMGQAPVGWPGLSGKLSVGQASLAWPLDTSGNEVVVIGSQCQLEMAVRIVRHVEWMKWVKIFYFFMRFKHFYAWPDIKYLSLPYKVVIFHLQVRSNQLIFFLKKQGLFGHLSDLWNFLLCIMAFTCLVSGEKILFGSSI